MFVRKLQHVKCAIVFEFDKYVTARQHIHFLLLSTTKNRLTKMKLLLVLSLVAAASAGHERIINGVTAESMAMTPWQVSLQQAGRHFCGGSLVSEQFVMSACHCQMSDVTVNMGSIEYKNPIESIPVDTFICHERYSRLRIDFDYAVLKMVAPVSFISGQIEPIMLPELGVEYPGGMPALISGWGLTVANADTVPDILQFANTELVDDQECLERLGKTITPRMQCAGLLGNTACNGDSGGPLVVKDENGNNILVGNTSFGVVNCPTAAASVWSKNSAVRDWIDLEMSL